MSSLDTFRAAYGRVSDAELRAVAERARTTAGALSPEAWLALTEEMERRGLTPPHEMPAGVDLDLSDAQPGAAAPPGLLRRAVRYAKAPLLNRLGAYIIDTLVAVVPVLLAAVLALSFGVYYLPYPFPAGPFALLVVGAVLWALYYMLTKDGWGEGQSIGKRAMGLMVVKESTNEPCSKLDSLVRMLVLWGLSSVPLVGWFIEPVMVLATGDGRRLGDRAAGTQVIAQHDYRRDGPLTTT